MTPTNTSLADEWSMIPRRPRAASLMNEAATVACSGFTFDMLNDAPGCAAMFTGTVASGGACEDSYERALPGSGCGAYDPNGEGACIAPAALGESCVEAHGGAGLFCASSGASAYSCAVPAAEGAPCTFDAECAGGYCDPTATACGPRNTQGAACMYWGDCAEGTCDAATQTCVPPLPDGADCKAHQGVLEWNRRRRDRAARVRDGRRSEASSGRNRGLPVVGSAP